MRFEDRSITKMVAKRASQSMLRRVRHVRIGLRRVDATIWLVAAAIIAGCGSSDDCGHMTTSGPFNVVAEPPVVTAPSTIVVSSPNLEDGVSIPIQFTCAGIGESPGLRWEQLPEGTRQIAFVVSDPDAPGGTFYHWTVYGISPRIEANAACQVPAGARQGVNGAGQDHYYPPCPPADSPAHNYTFTVYALDAPLHLSEGASPVAVLDAIRLHALAQGILVAPFALP